MKTVEKFQCEYCGHIYNTAEECQKCEEKHKTEFKITGLDYPDIVKFPNGYPSKLVLHFEDDREDRFVEYSFTKWFSKKKIETETETIADDTNGQLSPNEIAALFP